MALYITHCLFNNKYNTLNTLNKTSNLCITVCYYNSYQATSTLYTIIALL